MPSTAFADTQLRTPRCILRPFRPADLAGVFEGLGDPRVVEHYGVRYATLEGTTEQLDWYARIQREGTGQWWCICLAEAPDRLIGACGVNDIDREHRRAEIGYWLLPAYWGRGLAQEAVAEALRHAFAHLGIHRIGADVDMGNHASAALLAALGFTREGVRRGYEMKDGRPIDLQLFSLLATDGPAVPTA